MTTHFRTLLLLGFTALTASLSGCFVETTHDRGGPRCAVDQYFQVYWSIDNGNANAPLACGQEPSSHVELVTSTGDYPVGKECRPTTYMGYGYNFAGSTYDGVPVGTYVITAKLVSDINGALLSEFTLDPSDYGTYPISPCAPMTHAFAFSLF